MKKLTTLFLVLGLASAANAELVLTGMFDGPLSGGLPKVVELYSHGDTDLDMYAAGSANNGGGTDGIEDMLTGFAADGTFVYIVSGFGTNGLDGDFGTYFAGQIPAGAQIFATSGAAFINGDDAVELFKYGMQDNMCVGVDGSESVHDVFGDINVDGSGQPWDHLDGWAYRNASTGPDGSTFQLGSWSFSGVDANDGESDNASAANPFPIGSFTHSGPSMNEVDCIPVPEPTGFLMAGCFGLGLLFVRKR